MSQPPPQPVAAPDKLVDSAGRVTFGVFARPLPCINLEDARLTYRGLRLPRPLVRFRLKRWQHYGLITPELFVGLALVDTGFLRTSWCSVVDRVSGEHFEHKRLGPILNLVLPRELWAGEAYIRARGYRIDVKNRLDRGAHELTLDIAARRGKPAVQGVLSLAHDLDAIRPLVVVLPVGPNRGMYSHKVPLPTAGRLRIGDREHRLDAAEAVTIVDIHRAHYPRHTWWRWATGAGRDAQGRQVGFNLTFNVAEDQARWNENGVWLDGALQHLGVAHFDFDPHDVLAPWRLTTDCGRVDLVFTPQGERQERVNVGVIRSVFHQPYGTFAGTVIHGEETVEVADLFGVCEDHDALW